MRVSLPRNKDAVGAQLSLSGRPLGSIRIMPLHQRVSAFSGPGIAKTHFPMLHPAHRNVAEPTRKDQHGHSQVSAARETVPGH